MRSNFSGPAPRPCLLSCRAFPHTTHSSPAEQLGPAPQDSASSTWGHLVLLQHPAPGMFPAHPILFPSSVSSSTTLFRPWSTGVCLSPLQTQQARVWCLRCPFQLAQSLIPSVQERLGKDYLHQVPPGLPRVQGHPLRDSWLDFSGKYQWGALLMSKCPNNLGAFSPFEDKRGAGCQALPGHLCFPGPKRTSATGEEWAPWGHLWGNVPAVPTVSLHSVRRMVWK